MEDKEVLIFVRNILQKIFVEDACRRSGGDKSIYLGRCGSFLTMYSGYSHEMFI